MEQDLVNDVLETLGLSADTELVKAAILKDKELGGPISYENVFKFAREVLFPGPFTQITFSTEEFSKIVNF